MRQTADRRRKKEEKPLLGEMPCLRETSGEKGVSEKGVLCVWLAKHTQQETRFPTIQDKLP